MTAGREAGPAASGPLTNVWNPDVAAKASALFQALPAPAIHYAGLAEAEVRQRLRSEAAYQQLMREKLAGKWFAALVATEGAEPGSIQADFKTWRGLVEFLAEQNALVEVWACGEAGDHKVRRIPAAELAEAKQQRQEPPALLTVTYQDRATGQAVSCNLEFGFQAAATVRAANQAYQRHRALQLSARKVLSARNGKGLPDALAQWEALQTEFEQQRLPLAELPPRPKEPRDLFVAFEFAVDEQNNFLNVAGLYRDSEVRKKVIGDAQVLLLQRAGEKSAREVWGFRRQGLSDHLEPAPNAILGQEVVELRVKDAFEADPKGWHVLEFGESEVLKQSALAHFSQLNAYLERNRKAQLMKQANLALIAEPIIAALNVGGGLAGLCFPAGESARLLYNLITWKLISNVPTVKQMRELFALMAARDRNPQIKLKPERFLSKDDIQALREAGRKLSDQEVQTYLEQMSQEDVRAMLRLARQGMLDARVTTFLNLLTSSFKVSGVSDEAGPIRDIFNNVRFSMNGDINLKTLLMLAIGKRVMTPLSGASLETLSHGQGPHQAPQDAWLQYLEVSVDLRAVLNTLVRLTKPTYAKKELEKPFPYAPRLTEPAAYEVRIFGFPLLMFYKRGLIKADFEAYQHDYAYGLRGVSVVEHFPTREAMEAEILAGRMFPLGLVRVPSAKGGWKETDLVVYAHRMRSGKHRGKTALIIYGLRAYVEYSDLIARELLRFKAFERGLQEGAVIEQMLREEAAAPVPALAFEPLIHVGSNAVQQVYNPLLGALLELRRNWLRQSWGLPVDTAELSRARQELAARGVQPAEGDPLLSVDPYQSSFIYKREVGGREQRVKVTHIPSLADVEREMQKAQEGELIEAMRREAAAGQSAGVVLLNEAREVQGHLELGPLLRDQQGQVVGAGVTSGAKSIAAILDLINRLPVTDRARLRGNHFAATAVELDRDGPGRQKVFLTIEFPLGEVRQAWTNPLTGEPETVLYENGLWRQTITGRRIVELDYDQANVERGSRTYCNRGDQQAPLRGALLEETRTLEYWLRDLSQPGLDPYQPTIAKLRVNYVTGQLARETYGLFPQPVETLDEQYITRNRYTRYGIFESASVIENGREESDFSRPVLERLLQPVAGRPRFQLASQLAGNGELRDLSTAGYRTVLEQKDLVKGLVATQTIDQGHFGRKIAENHRDLFDGTRSFWSGVTWEYDEDFHCGLVPVRATTRSLPSGAPLAEVTITAYDPLRRRLTGSERTYTGQTRTNTWDYRWANPVELETLQRRITQQYNRDETETRSTTLLKVTGEVINQSSGQYDAGNKTWRVTRRIWYRPDIPDHTETNLYSAFGLLIAARIGDALEARPTYAADGTEQSSQTFRRNAASGRYDILYRQEDDYHWQNGQRNARVRLFLDGLVADDYRSLADAEGRVLEDGIHQWPQLELRTVRTYDGDSERLRQAEVRQNGQIRATHQVLGAFPQPGGGWWLKVAVTPFWGLAFTNSYLVGEPLGRLAETEFENGDRARVAAWLAESAVAQRTELVDRHGHPQERWVKQGNAGTAAGLPYDLVRRYKLSPWGEAGLVEEKALVRGTDVALFCDKVEERIYFDLSRNYECSHFAVDPGGHFGLPLSIAGSLRTNVTAVFTARIRERGDLAQTNRPTERALEVTSVDLRGLIYHPFSRRSFDRAGHLLEEQAGKLRNWGPRPYSDAALLVELSQAPSTRRAVYAYEPCWVQDKVEAETGQALVTSFKRPATNSGTWSVNDAGWREWPTGVKAYQIVAQGPGPAAGTAVNLFRRLYAPRLLKQNRHLPGVTNVWMAWPSADFNAAGAKLFESEITLDARGELSTLVARKLNSRGQPGTKIVYQLPPPDLWRTASPPQGAHHLSLNLGGPQDLSGCDFVGFYLEAPATARVGVQLRDLFNHSVLVAGDGGVGGTKALSFWPVGQGQVSWLPNERIPRHGAVVAAPRNLVTEGKVFVLSIPELARAGLEVGRLASLELTVANSETNSLRVTPLYRLEHGQRFLPPEAGARFDYDSQAHSSGLVVYRRKKSQLPADQALTGRGWNTVLRYEGGLVGVLNPRPEPPYYPVLVVTDSSDPDSPRPLYALAAEDGKFLEYYQTLGTGDIQVYTVVNGFETPKMEVFRGGVLDDEITPGILAFGHRYYVTVPMAKASGGLASVLARLHNRCVASAFALGGDNLLRSVFKVDRVPTELKQVTRKHGLATAQAQEINRFPTLAEALLSRQPAPWTQAGTASLVPATLDLRTNALRTLRELSGSYLKTTKLIPTLPATKGARYVDTAQEAALIELAAKLHETVLANDLLAFYWEKSQGGAYPLHACYDAETGASLTKQTRYARPSDAQITARAQLAIAEAAFCLGTATGDRDTLEFGKNLIQLLLDRFRPSTNDMAWPRGIAESATNRVVRMGGGLAPALGGRGIAESATNRVVKPPGLTLWPEAKTFSLASNARAYLLFRRLSEQAEGLPFGPEWKETLLAAADEQAAWLTNRIVPYVQATGVVPKGLFEIQDVHNETRALAVERWTTTDDWLSFIEAADRLGLSKELTRAWLDNLARAHGVTVRGVWGLDWTIALQRPDAISVDLTAKFLRVARLLGHAQAADFAQQNLSRLRQGDKWPAVVTDASTNAPLETGQGFELYPADNTPEEPGKAGGTPARLHPPDTTPASKGRLFAFAGWPEALGLYAELADSAWPAKLEAGNKLELRGSPARDITQFFWTAAGFYLSMVAVALFWWGLSYTRRRRRAKATAGAPAGLLVSEAVMRQAEERWAKRVLGLRIPAGAERSRYANGAIEQNFHIQLRAIYKLVLEWRRGVNAWSETDARLVEDDHDEWLNGLDEFAVMVGIYMRWVIKAGRKDGLPKADVLQENEDSNHIWSRLVMYFSESHLRLLTLIKEFQANPAAAAVLGLNDQIELVLRMMGLRARAAPFDARSGFDVPAGASALDLLLLQRPGASLAGIVEEMERKWDIPREHVVSFIKGYKSFKAREQLFPIHPYLLEIAKILPHFLLMGLVALIWYNNDLGGLKIYPYLRESVTDLALDWHSLLLAAPLLAGFALSVVAHLLRVYRYRWGTRSASGAAMTLDTDLINLFGRPTEVSTPALRVGRRWNPVVYERAGWICRAVGLALLASALFKLEPPSFATFMCVKGLLGTLLLVESAGLLLPLIFSRFSSWLEDRVTGNPRAWRLTRFLNQLNLVPTRPASLIWLSIKHHFQPSMPTGGFWPMLQAIASYLLTGAIFFFVGSYMYKQALEIWFQETYRHGWDLRLVLGALLFWNTMYLLRFGLFILLAALSSAAAIYPFKVAGGLGAVACFALQFGNDAFAHYVDRHLGVAGAVLLLGLVLMAYESQFLAWLRNWPLWRGGQARRQEKQRAALEQLRRDPNRALGVVYMSGDDLSFHKLTPELLVTRLQTLRDRLGSGGMRLLARVHSLPPDTVVTQWFAALYELEQRHAVTLWHPLQLVMAGDTPRLPPELGLNLAVESAGQREQLLVAWHLRRWLVTMMSTAGHAQDTAINLVDLALGLAREGLGANTVFYLIQNKYDNNDNNRPSQLPYDQGELGQRNKLARLLMAVAPGARAYSINDWTPFGFKAGGLVGMDLVYEESLKLTNMLILDRNANAHDLEAVVADLKLALSDPGVVIVIPGRSTTNTLTPIGQSSQLVEEGQRALTRGVMLLGGVGAETLGTGWGNIQAIYYGRVQRALCDTNTPKMPLTTPAARNATFGDRCEGLVGFGPHAIGISEDIWGVTQATHNALALGYQVKFHRSQALWHKIRESWSHAEWLSAFPRWAGGYLQMMLDPIMQKINEAGPLSVFAKEIRASGGRFFLSAPSALLSILLMPLAIIWDVSPFVQILILLWNLGLVMNQVLTALGLVACLESTGFNRLTALAGAAGAALLARTVVVLTPFALPLIVWGFLAGGFTMGLGRWLYYRGRDVILFGPQLVIHTLGQVVRQSLEFVLSGASANDARAVNIAFRAWVGPREDRPFEGYQNFVNLRTVVWGVGLAALLLDLFALANLDFLNVLLLLPSLMFSVSALVGPFLMQPKPGQHLGWAVWVPKLLGWLASLGFYLLVAWLIAGGGWREWLGVGLSVGCFSRVLLAGLKYVGYARRLQKLVARLAQQMVEGGLAITEAQPLAQNLVRGLGGEVEKTRAALQKTSLPAERQAGVMRNLQDQVWPFLKRPLTDLQAQRFANPRFICECSRSFVLGLFTFVWFFVVPMPGLLVFTAPGGYRIWTLLSSVLLFAATALGVVFGAGILSLLLEWWEKNRLTGQGLVASIEAQYRSFQSLAAQPGKLAPVDTAHLYAMFTDVQTYFDQRSYAYARRALGRIKQTLKAAAGLETAAGDPPRAVQPTSDLGPG
ncbi:MAG: hypothetical protein ABSF95_10165 [Verrucomicrobiota bacterium]